MADDIKPIDIGVSVQMTDGAHTATWSFEHESSDRDATQVRLFSGQEYRVTYRLSDAGSWRIDALSLRRVSDSTDSGFVTLIQGQTTDGLELPDGAGTLAVEVFAPDSVSLSITNTLSSGSEPLTLGLSLTVSSTNSQSVARQSSQDPQMVLEPRNVPPPTLPGA